MDNIMQQVNSPADLKKLSSDELKQYASEVRRYIIETVTKNGGHLASNLGTVELSIALHYVFTTPQDKIIWDVGHQSYTHKIITGRRDVFSKLRRNDGITGFPNSAESDCDVFTTGHSSASLSSGLGLARARDLMGDNSNIVCVIGDGAFTGGLALEALNDIGASKSKMIIILNDNKMSISKNVGAMSNYLAKLRLSKRYARLKYNIKRGARGLPFFGDKIFHALDETKENIKSLLQKNKVFESIGIKYYGPFDGHNIANMIDILSRVKKENKPALIHLITHKGQGDYEAEVNPSFFHGVSPVKEQGESFSSVLGNFLVDNAQTNSKIVAISAAMMDGTGLSVFKKAYPDRCFDVGIAEQHAVTMAAGLARGGCKPYFAVYSTFLQRAFDQVLHDVCLNDLPVTLAIDRAGVVGSDGVTHQGLFDLSYLQLMPNLTIVAPKDGDEYLRVLNWSLDYPHPLAIRYPKNYITKYEKGAEIKLGKWETLKTSKKRVYILAVGNRMLDIAMKIDANIVNCVFVKPLDSNFLREINKKNNLIITLEDNVLMGGFGEEVTSFINSCGAFATVKPLGFSDKFENNLVVGEALASCGLTTAGINAIIANF